MARDDKSQHSCKRKFLEGILKDGDEVVSLISIGRVFHSRRGSNRKGPVTFGHKPRPGSNQQTCF